MATTIVPAFDEPISKNVNLEELRKGLKEALISAQADEDKANDPHDAFFYEGQIEVLTQVLKYLTGKVDKDGRCLNAGCSGFGNVHRADCKPKKL